EVGRDEVPDVRALVEAELADAGLVGVHVGGLRYELERYVVERAQSAGAAVEQVAHRAARHRDADVAVRLLEPVLRKRVTALADGQARNEARAVTRLLADAVTMWPQRQARVSRRYVRLRKCGCTYSITLDGLPLPTRRRSFAPHFGHVQSSGGTGTGIVSLSSRASSKARFSWHLARLATLALLAQNAMREGLELILH